MPAELRLSAGGVAKEGLEWGVPVRERRHAEPGFDETEDGRVVLRHVGDEVAPRERRHHGDRHPQAVSIELSRGVTGLQHRRYGVGDRGRRRRHMVEEAAILA